MAKKPSSDKGAIYTYCDAKAVKDMINAFLNEMEVALLLDVKDFHDNGLISNDVYDAFINRDMATLDRLFKEDLESTRIAQMREQATLKSGSGSVKKLTKWDGEHFKVLLPNSLFKHSQAVSKNTPPILLLGSPGIGKSDIIRSIAMDRKFGKEGILDIRLSQKEAVDMRGFPVPNDVTRTVDWFISSEWPRNPLSRGILFFDELTSATKSVQVGAYEIILDRKLGDVHSGGYELPTGWFICAAGNLADDDAAVEDVSSALANRMMHLVIEVDVDSWLIWADKNGVHPAVISYITTPSVYNGLESRYKLHCMNVDPSGKSPLGKLLPVVDRQKGWPSPRSWTRLSTVLHTYETAKSFTREEMLKRYDKILTKEQIIAMSIDDAKYLNRDTLEDMIIGLIGLNLGMDFIAFYTSFKIAIDSAINLALIGVNPEKIQKINDPQAFPLITPSNINRLSSFEKIQNEDLSINNSKKKVSEYEEILNTLFSTDASISVTEQLKYKELFGSEPLSFLTTVGSLLSSRQYLKQLASQLQISVDAIGVDILTNAYKMSIRNVIEFMSNLKGSASFTKSHFAATVSSLSMKPDMSSKPILSQSIKNALNQRSREELRALIGQAGSQAAAASNSKAANYITKISANILQGSNSNQNSGLQVNRTNTSTAGNKARSFNNTNQELMNSLGINQSTNSKKPESKTSSNQGSGLSPQAVKNRAQKVKNNISVTNNAFPDDIDQ